MSNSNLDAKFQSEFFQRKTSKDFLYRIFQDDFLNSSELNKRNLRPTMTEYNIVLYDDFSGGSLQIRHSAFGQISLALVSRDGAVVSEQLIGKPIAEIDRELADRLLTALVTSIES